MKPFLCELDVSQKADCRKLRCGFLNLLMSDINAIAHLLDNGFGWFLLHPLFNSPPQGGGEGTGKYLFSSKREFVINLISLMACDK
ncbi:MAG: hypothetical protein UR51_C0019G0017 [Candidatus Moranbacteria bacterium GW2011_GWF1_34_10]|nr:MAG: hypothetical protein UR51_C0019G0017 [Candidatus Moranbacteria bacterium GW2011_GWF1_34_10]